MMRKILSILVCAVAFFASLDVSAKDCLGLNYEQVIADDNTVIPSVSIASLQNDEIGSGESILISAVAQYDENANPFFYWCADQGSFAFADSQNYETVRYTAPEEPESFAVNISVKVGDGLGYIATDSLQINLASPGGEGEGPGAFLAPILLAPIDQSENISLGAILDWSDVQGASDYRVQVAAESTFVTSEDGKICTNCLVNKNINDSEYGLQAGDIEFDTTYYWRVRAGSLEHGPSPWSEVYSFKTKEYVHPPEISKVSIDNSNCGEPKLVFEISYGQLDKELGQSGLDLGAGFILSQIPSLISDDGIIKKYSANLLFANEKASSAVLRAKFYVDGDDGSSPLLDSPSEYLITNNAAKYRNIVEGFTNANEIGVDDGFDIQGIASSVDANATLHLLFRKQFDDTSSSQRKITDKIYYNSYKDGKFSCPSAIYNPPIQNVGAGLDGYKQIDNMQIAVDPEEAKHIFFTKSENTENWSLYYLYEGAEEIVDNASFIRGLSVAISGNQRLLTWTNDKTLYVKHQIASGKISSPAINLGEGSYPKAIIHNGQAYVFYKKKDIVHYKVLVNGEWIEEQLLTQFIEDWNYQVYIDNNGVIHLSWVDGALNYYRSDDSEHYRVIASRDYSPYKFNVNYDNFENPHWVYSGSASYGPVFYQQERNSNLYSPKDVSPEAALPKAGISFSIADNKRFIFYMDKAKDDDGLYHLMATISPLLGEDSDQAHSSNPFFGHEAEVKDVKIHPNALTCNPDLHELVCGEDGVSYQNECYALKGFTQVAYQGECITHAELIAQNEGPFSTARFTKATELEFNNFSYSTFFKVNEMDAAVTLLEQPPYPVDRTKYQRIYIADNKLRFDAGGASCISRRRVYEGESHHVAVTYDQQKGFNLYLDGVLECSKPYPGKIAKETYILLGASLDNNWDEDYSDIEISNFKYYRFGLTAEEVSNLYAEVTGELPTVPEAFDDIVLKLDFENGVEDISGNNLELINTHEYSYSYYGSIRTEYYDAVAIQDEQFSKVAKFQQSSHTYSLNAKENGYIALANNQMSAAMWIKPEDQNHHESKNLISSAISMGRSFEGKAYCKLGAADAYKVGGDSVVYSESYIYDWTHLACIYDGSSLKIYINGELDAEAARNIDVKDKALEIKMWGQGLIDDVLVTAKVLDAGEIKSMFLDKVQDVEALKDSIDVDNSGLTAYYPFEFISDESGTKIFRDQVNGQDAVISGSIELINGIHGKAADLNQVGMTIRDTKSYGLRDRYSISFWMKPKNGHRGYTMTRLSENYNYSNFPGFSFTNSNYNGKKLGFNFSSGMGSNKPYVRTYGNEVFDYNKWQLITFVYDRGNLKAYKNNELVSEYAGTEVIDFANHEDAVLYIGRVFNTPTYLSEARFAIDELSFFNRALGLEEIQKRYNFGVLNSFPGECGQASCPESNAGEIRDITMDNLGKFNLEFKKHNIYGANVSGGFYNNSSYAYVGGSTGGLYAFKSFDKGFLEGKKLRVTTELIGGNHPYAKEEPRFMLKMLDGEYHNDVAEDFPVGSFNFKGNGVIQVFDNHISSRATQTQTIEIDTSSATKDQLTIFFEYKNKETYTNMTYRIYGMEILDADDNVVAVLDKSGEIKNDILGHDQINAYTKPVKKRFNLELREYYSNYDSPYNGYQPHVTFSREWTGSESVLKVYSNHGSNGQAYAFKSFKKDLLNGKKLKITWDQTSPYPNGQVKIDLYKGKYSRSSSGDFPEHRAIANKGLIKNIATNIGSKDKDTVEEVLDLSSVNEEDVTLMFSLNDNNRSGWMQFRIYKIQVLDDYGNPLLEFDGASSYPSMELNGSSTYDDRGTIGVDDLSPPSSGGGAAQVFNLEVKEHRYSTYYNYYPNVTFSKYGSAVYAYSDYYSVGGLYVFKTFDKKLLEGKTLRFTWETNASRYTRAYFYAYILNGQYNAASNYDFPERGRMKVNGSNWLVQSLDYAYGSSAKHTVTVPMNLSKAYGDYVTLMFKAEDSSNRYGLWYRIYDIEVLGDDGQVLARFDNSAPVTMTQRYSYQDYGVVGHSNTFKANNPPEANASSDQESTIGATVTLDASGSLDPDGDALSYYWKQISGPVDVYMSDMLAKSNSFIAPMQGEFEFELTVTDSKGDSSKDTVKITVKEEEQVEADGDHAEGEEAGNSDADSIEGEPKKFALSLREHKCYSIFSSNTSFSKPDANSLKLSSSNSNGGVGYAFKTFSKEFLQGRKLRFKWSSSNNDYNVYYNAIIYDGSYDRSNSADFPDNNWLTLKGAGNVQNIATIKDNTSNNLVEVDLDLSKSTQDEVTLMFLSYDAWGGVYTNLTIHEVEILDAQGNVLAYFDSSAPLIMERSNSTADYGYIGTD